MGYTRLLNRGAPVVQSGRLSCSIGARQLSNRGGSVALLGRTNRSIGAHQLSTCVGKETKKLPPEKSIRFFLHDFFFGRPPLFPFSRFSFDKTDASFRAQGSVFHRYT